MIRKLVGFIGVIIFLAVGALVALPYLVPKEKVRQMVSDGSKGAITYGDVKVVFWPNIGVALSDVVLLNEKTKEKEATIGRLDVAVAVMPLLDRKVVVKQFTLEEPALYGILTEKDGGVSFSSGLQERAAEKPATPAEKPAASPAGVSASDFSFKFEKLRIAGGKLIATNQQNKAFVDAIGLDVKMIEGGALQAAGGLSYNGKKIALELSLDKLQDFIDGKASPGQISLKTDDFSIKADGTLATKDTFLKGSLSFEAASLARVLAWVPGMKEQKAAPFEKISFSSTANVSASEIILKGADLKLDDVQAKGDVNVSLGGKPEIFARLSLNKLNLDRFTGEDKAAAGAAGEAKKPDSQGWDTTPIDFSGLKAVNADLKLETQGFSLRGAEVGPSTLTVTLQNGDLKFASSEASLFGGKFASDLALNANTNALGFNFTMGGVQAKPVLETFAGFKKLSGTAEGRVSITASGNSQKAIIGSLGGDGNLVFRNGSLEGIDFVKIAKMVQSRLSDIGVGEGKTDFVEMGGTFKITKGIVSNDDLKMKGPLLQMTGKGTVDLPQKVIRYRATPVLTASSGVEDAKGLAVPVDVTGPFSKIKVVPDFLSVAKSIAENPEELKATAKDAAKNVRDNVRDIRQELKKDPGAAIQNILGGGGLGSVLGGSPKPAAPVAPEAAVPATPDAAPAPAAPLPVVPEEGAVP